MKRGLLAGAISLLLAFRDRGRATRVASGRAERQRYAIRPGQRYDEHSLAADRHGLAPQPELRPRRPSQGEAGEFNRAAARASRTASSRRGHSTRRWSASSAVGRLERS